MKKKEYVMGLDLGTSNSCVAIVEGGIPTIIPNKLQPRISKNK